jgi:hypothetical protein
MSIEQNGKYEPGLETRPYRSLRWVNGAADGAGRDRHVGSSHFGEKLSILKGFCRCRPGTGKNGNLAINQASPWPAWPGWPDRIFRHLFWPLLRKIVDMLTVMLFLAGFVCFYLFFKTIDYFEKI